MEVPERERTIQNDAAEVSAQIHVVVLERRRMREDRVRPQHAKGPADEDDAAPVASGVARRDVVLAHDARQEPQELVPAVLQEERNRDFDPLELVLVLREVLDGEREERELARRVWFRAGVVAPVDEDDPCVRLPGVWEYLGEDACYGKVSSA